MHIIIQRCFSSYAIIHRKLIVLSSHRYLRVESVMKFHELDIPFLSLSCFRWKVFVQVVKVIYYINIGLISQLISKCL